MVFNRISKAALLLALFLARPAYSEPLPKTYYLPTTMALEAARAALDACADDGFAVSVAIVTRQGTTTALVRADAAGPHTTASATGKAFTAASLGRDSGTLASAIVANPEVSGLRDMDPRLVILGGGLPIRVGNSLVGGIGVGGAPSASQDRQCAIAGLQAIGAAIPD